MIFLTIFAIIATLEEKVGQLLMVHLYEEDAPTLVQDLHVGGVIYYNWANDLSSPERVRRLSANLQELATTPLLIAVDQEGGRVERLQFLHFPSNSTVGEMGDPEVAEQIAFGIGQGLLDVGINMNLAPVVDVCRRDRSFGDSPEMVQRFAERALAGYRKAGVLTVLKHYPGLGDAEVDSHVDLPVLHKSMERGLAPFAGLASQASAIMTAHLLVPALDAESCATLSKPILNLLRKQIGFEGVIISDSLVMEGVLKNCNHSVEEAAIRAFNAGCDILMLAGKQLVNSSNFELTATDVRRIHGALVDAVRNGRISEKQVDRSVRRILQIKKPLWRGAMQHHPLQLDGLEVAPRYRPAGLERWEVEELPESERLSVLRWAEQQGMMLAWVPATNEYERAMLLGATTATMAGRLRYLEQLWREGVRFKEVVWLTGDRPLNGGGTESDAARELWATTTLDVPVQFVSVPMKSNGRPNTADTVISWLATNPAPGPSLFVSNQPFCGYQFAVIRAVLPEQMSFDVVGAEAGSLLSAAVILDTLARWRDAEQAFTRATDS